MKKKIWILNHYSGGTFFSKGGRHYSIAKYLKRRGYDPTIFCCNAKHSSSAELFHDEDILWSKHIAEEIDVPFVFVKGRKYTGNGKQRILNMIDFYRNVKVAACEYEKEAGQPDVIYASSVHPLTLVAGIQIAKTYGVKCVCEIRDLWPESLIEYDMISPHNPITILLRRLEKWIYTKSDSLVFTAEGAYNYILEQGWEKEISRSKVYYINNGVDLESFNYNKEHYQIDDPDLMNSDIFKIVYTGSIRKVNNLGLLLDVAKEVHDRRVKFLIWGDGNELPFLRQRIVSENIDNVVFKGSVNKQYIPYIVSCADLNIAHNSNASLFEYGISFNKIFDYLAARKPVLCDFSSSYNPVVMTNSGVGLDNVGIENIVAEITKFANMDSSEYQTYCQNATKAANIYSFDNLVDELIKIIEG